METKVIKPLLRSLFISYALSALFFRKYFLRNCDSSFSIFRHALQTFSTFDAFSNFLLTFYFYMIFLSTYGIIFKKKENLYFINYFSFNLYVKLTAGK